MGTSEISLECLKLLLRSEVLQLRAIISRPESLQGRGLKSHSTVLADFAKKNSYPIWTPENVGDIDFLKKLSEKKCDFSFVCSYGKLLPLSYLKIFPKACLNLHFSLLPKWRGAAPVQRALLAGEQHTGVSLQVMEERLDAGDIVGQREFPIHKNENSRDIFNKALKYTELLLEKELREYLEGNLKLCPQDHSQKSYAQKIKKQEAEILWNQSAEQIHNQIRALFLGPQAFSFFYGKRVKIYQSECFYKDHTGLLPGQVDLVEKDKLFITCGQGFLSVLELQKEGKKRQKVKDFLKGNAISREDYFGS